MSHDEATEQSRKFLHLIGKEFLMKDNTPANIKAVVPWDEGNGNWQPHVCFYDWGRNVADGEMTHMNLGDFFRKFNVPDT